MAYSTIADFGRLNTVTREDIVKSMIDQINESSPTWASFLKNQVNGSGLQYEQPVKYSQTDQIEWYTGIETTSPHLETPWARAIYPWKFAKLPMVLSNPELAQNKGKNAVLDLKSETVTSAVNDFTDDMGDKIFDTAGTNEFGGLDDIINATNTYAGINASTYTWWGSDVDTVATLTLTAMGTLYNSAARGTEKTETPDCITTTQTVWNIYEALLTPQIRYTNTGSADGGFGNLVFRSTPIKWDKHANSQEMYFINSKFMKLVTLKHPMYGKTVKGFAMSDFEKLQGQDGQTAYLYFYGTPICTSRRNQARASSVAA